MQNKQISKCAVLVSSCDKYADVWIPFFHFFKKNWKECTYPIYLNTESKSYVDKDIQVTSLNCKKKGASWSTRLKKALKRIKEEYVILLLEDFFLLNNVDQKELDRCVSIMDNDKKVSMIDFNSWVWVPTEPFCEGYVQKTQNANWLLTCQAGIWRRKDLIQYLSSYESPWQFEEIGTERAKLYGRKFLLSQNPNTVFTYIVDWVTGYGVHEGKWLKSNVELFKKEGISVDFEKMGFLEITGKVKHCDCPPVKITFNWKWKYLLYGGYEERRRMPIAKQFLYLFIHPKTFLIAIGRKIKFLFKSKESI